MSIESLRFNRRRALGLSLVLPWSVVKAQSSSLTLPVGSGAGVHGANSPYRPIEAKKDVLPWTLLTEIKPKMVGGRIVPGFGQRQLDLHKRTVKLEGFMMPLDASTSQRHFLLTSVPLGCPFCTPGGPESMVEVRADVAVKYELSSVVVQGVFEIVQNNSDGILYRMVGASPVA